MMTIFIVALSIIAVIAIAFIIALFLPKEYTIERSIDIDQSRETVFNYIQLVRNTEHFSKWVMQDPNARREYVGTDGQVGFVFKWDSADKKVGTGEQEIMAIQVNEKIEFEIRFIKPFSGKSISYMETKSLSADRTHLHWVFNGIMKYPNNFVMLFLNFDKILGKDQEISLQNLKNILEKDNFKSE